MHSSPCRLPPAPRPRTGAVPNRVRPVVNRRDLWSASGPVPDQGPAKAGHYSHKSRRPRLRGFEPADAAAPPSRRAPETSAASHEGADALTFADSSPLTRRRRRRVARLKRPPPATKEPKATEWLGRKDSNLRIRDSKSRALPLGDAPPSSRRNPERDRHPDCRVQPRPCKTLIVDDLRDYRQAGSPRFLVKPGADAPRGFGCGSSRESRDIRPNQARQRRAARAEVS
jgi:hypothetical protein